MYFCRAILNSKQSMLLRFLKDWTLPIAMVAGVMLYFLYADIDCWDPLRPAVHEVIAFLTPFLIFAQLLLTFCKVRVRDLAPKRWNVWLLLIQFVSFMAVALVLMFVPMSGWLRIVGEGMMVCLICPTATAAAVITGKLGGSAASLTTYTLLSNILAAVFVPLMFPLVEPSDFSFFSAFLRILSKVFPLLLCPFILAVLLKAFLPSVHRFLVSLKDLAFYLWAVALTIVMAQTTKSVMTGQTSVDEELLIALGAMLVCCLQFYYGKKIGGRYDDRISGGQALGQKNTVLAIWMACTYLNPSSAIAPGSYVVWQNIINSWQLWKKAKRDKQKGK